MLVKVVEIEPGVPIKVAIDENNVYIDAVKIAELLGLEYPEVEVKNKLGGDTYTPFDLYPVDVLYGLYTGIKISNEKLMDIMESIDDVVFDLEAEYGRWLHSV